MDAKHRVCSKPGFSRSGVLHLVATARERQPQKYTRAVVAFAIDMSSSETRRITVCSVDKNAFKLARVTVERHNAAKV